MASRCPWHDCKNVKEELDKIIRDIIKETKKDAMWINCPEQWMLLYEKTNHIHFQPYHYFVFTYADRNSFDDKRVSTEGVELGDICNSNKILCLTDDVMKKYPVINNRYMSSVSFGSIKSKNFVKLTDWLYGCGQWKNGSFWNEELEELQKKNIQMEYTEDYENAVCNTLMNGIKEIKKITKSEQLNLGHPKQWFLLSEKISYSIKKYGIKVVITNDKINQAVPLRTVKKIYPILEKELKISNTVGTPDDKACFIRITDQIYMNGEWKDGKFYNEALEELQSYENFDKD